MKSVITREGESPIYGHWGWGDGTAFSWAGQEVLTKEVAQNGRVGGTRTYSEGCKDNWGESESGHHTHFPVAGFAPKLRVATDTRKHVSNRSPRFLHSQRVFVQHKLDTKSENLYLEENSEVLNVGV